jgi:hypothetical protein
MAAEVEYVVRENFANGKYKRGDVILDLSTVSPAHLQRYCVHVPKGTFGSKPVAAPSVAPVPSTAVIPEK